MEDVVAKANIHSCLVRTRHGSSVIVKEKLLLTDGSTLPNIVCFNNPRRSFYITSPRYQTYRFKPDYELISRCDKHTCCAHELNDKVLTALGKRVSGQWVDNATIFKHPYVFGADISIEALIKMKYLDEYPDANLTPTTGFLDIEVSIDTGQIILISYTYEDKVFTACLRSFCFREENGTRMSFDEQYITQHVRTTLENYTQGVKFDYQIKIFNTEAEIINWIFKHIHVSMVDFIGIWNMNYDLPKIISTLTKLGPSVPAAVFANPSIPAELRYFRYYEDKNRPVAHFTLRWHWLYSACGSQFIDSMGLYTQCRRTTGFRARYTLDSILKDSIGAEKLPLAEGSHTIMQRHHFEDYVAYNIFDVVGMRLLENKNGDITAANVLAGPTPISKFATQTTRATDNMYWNLIKKGMVLSSYSRDSDHLKFDKLFLNSGGAVLPPGNCRGVGINLTI